MNRPDSRARHVEVSAVAALSVLPLLPFLSAAVSIDAPVFLAVARQIAAHPFDPFGFDMIWDPISPRVAVFDHNPPLLSYYYAAWILAFGEREIVLHAALLPFPLVAALSFLGVARRLAGRGLGPAGLLLATPAFLVLASTLMLDVPMLAAWLFSVYALLRARERCAAGWQLAAGCAAALAGLIKYVGCASVPLLALGLWLWPCARERPGPRVRLAEAARVMGVPVLLWALWGIATQRLYGAPHGLGALAWVGARRLEFAALSNHALSVLIYCGGALLFPLGIWLAHALRSRSGALRALSAFGIAVLLVAGILPDGVPARRAPLEPAAALLAALHAAAAGLLLGCVLRPARALASPEDRFLAAWLAGVLLFSVGVNWHVGAGDALLAAPPAILLVFRDPALRPGPRALAAALPLLFCASLLLVAADVQQRDVYRSAAQRIVREIGAQPGQRWFVGHWGLQYYLEREGFQAVPPPQHGALHAPPIVPGDWIVSARNVSQLDVRSSLSRYRIRAVWHGAVAAALPLRVSNPDAGAGFYSHHTGYLPFAWSRAPLEEIGLGRVVGVKPERAW